MIYAQLLALVIAIPLGVIAAYRAGTRFDAVDQHDLVRDARAPELRARPAAQLLPGSATEDLANGGYAPGWLDPIFDSSRHMMLGDHLEYMFWPAITLAVGQIAIYMRLLRSDMIATLQEDFITMAKAKGIPNRRILWRHALRPSSLTLLTVAGLNVGALIGGAVVVEGIFGVPGMGEKLYQAIVASEYVALQSYVVVIAVLFVLVNFFVDILYAVLDPRIRHARAAA